MVPVDVLISSLLSFVGCDPTRGKKVGEKYDTFQYHLQEVDPSVDFDVV
jgi:hypothetical protein